MAKKNIIKLNPYPLFLEIHFFKNKRNTGAYVITLRHKETGELSNKIKLYLKEPFNTIEIVHECVHIFFAVYKYAGIIVEKYDIKNLDILSDDDREAYFFQFIYTSIIRYLDDNKKTIYLFNE